jgi:DNA helicase-2/ATP-dependent DNA helicase PcrA
VLRSELVYQFKNILESDDDINIDGPIEYLIVDEYQDLNKCDLRVIESLNEKGAKLFCAGDDDQSIYGFRYAYPEGIRNFTTEITNSEQHQITECHRCDENILKLAMDVIRQDFRRIPKKLKSITGLKGDTHLLRFSNQDDEANKIAELIFELVGNEITTENEIIILMRTDFHNIFSNVIKSALQNKGITINSKKGLYNIFESKVGRFFISIVKLFDNKSNDLALRNILLLTKGVGDVTINEIYNRAKATKKRFHSVISDIVEGKITDIKNYKLVKEKISLVYETVQSCKDSEDSLEEIIKSILALCDVDTSEFENDLAELISDLEMEELSELSSAIIDLFGPSEPLDENANGVRIMSMHQAKGLTADVVFIIAAEDEYIPGRGEVDEERRLFYVSLTRARHQLFITNCKNRTGQQQHSGFLNEQTPKRNLTRYLKNLPSIKPVDGNDFELLWKAS